MGEGEALTLRAQGKIDIDITMNRTYKDDGYALMLKKPSGRLQWEGIVMPFTLEVWIALGITIICAGIILALCIKQSKPNKDIDWTLHFLDVLHPMCGRNMMLPGFKASHLGKG